MGSALIEREREMEGSGQSEGKEKVTYTRHCGPARDLQISKIYQFPYQEVAICELGEGDHPRAVGQSKVSGIGSPHLTRGGGSLHHKYIWGC